MNSRGTKAGAVVFTVLLTVVLWTTVSTAPVVADEGSSVEDLRDRTRDIRTLQNATERTARLTGSSAAIGLGVGLIIGTGVAFGIWREKL
jgi:hypothetical protein